MTIWELEEHNILEKLFKSIREHQIHLQHLRLVLKRLFVLKEITEIEYSQKDSIFIKKHEKLQRLIHKEKISIDYCEEQTKELKRIAKELGIELNKVKICKRINGVKKCGLIRFTRHGRTYYLEKVSPFTKIIYRRRSANIEDVKKKGKFTKFTKYGPCWEKKTIRMNDSCRNLIYERSVEELMKDKALEKECTNGQRLSWREIVRNCLKKKHKKLFFEKIVQTIESKEGKTLCKPYKPSIKIERTKKKEKNQKCL